MSTHSIDQSRSSATRGGEGGNVTAEPASRDERSSELYWRSVSQQRPDWGWPDTPALSSEQAETERRVFDAAKQLERASQYGIPANAALEEFERARAEQMVMRLVGHA